MVSYSLALSRPYCPESSNVWIFCTQNAMLFIRVIFGLAILSPDPPLGMLTTHSDLKGDHFMLPFEDPAVLRDYVREQEANPAAFEERRGRPVYESRRDFGRLRRGVGFVKLTDFGLAVRGDVASKHSHEIQPLEYTAPEVMLQAGWTYSADIWNLGLVVCSPCMAALFTTTDGI